MSQVRKSQVTRRASHWKALAATVLLVGLGGQAVAQSPAAQRGLTFVLANCASCHSTDKVTDSTLAVAPAFRTLHLRYPVESLAEAFAEGIRTGHPTMAEFRLDPGQITDLIAFLKTLE
jgi:mono/diheme cytochrome c family protein